MVIDGVVRAVLAFVEGVMGLFPAWSFDEALGDFGTAAGQALKTAENFFPVDVLGGCIAVVLGLRVIILGFNGAVFVYKLIPGKFT